jgi:type VI secretion system secreted protein Hcp
MALTGYLYLKGKNQGKIEGDCVQKGREEAILVYAHDHEIEIPKDTHTGLPTGQRIHKPFTIAKKYDCATPKVLQACTSGEQMELSRLELFRINEKGKEEHFYTMLLGQAIIVKVRYSTPLTFLESSKPYHNMEYISFTYSSIIHIYEPKGIEAEDNWKEPKV